jgi:hypothetical protein
LKIAWQILFAKQAGNSGIVKLPACNKRCYSSNQPPLGGVAPRQMRGVFNEIAVVSI